MDLHQSLQRPAVTADSRKLTRQREAKLLRKFVTTYCRENHGTTFLCDSCQELQLYALARLAACPYHHKPACRRCPTHCYHPARRAQIREVMRFSGLYFVKRGRWDWLVKYFLMTRTVDRAQLRLKRRKVKREAKLLNPSI